MDGTTANCNFTKCVQTLSFALQQQGASPRRRFANLNDFKKYLQSEEELIADETEVRTERPAGKPVF